MKELHAIEVSTIFGGGAIETTGGVLGAICVFPLAVIAGVIIDSQNPCPCPHQPGISSIILVAGYTSGASIGNFVESVSGYAQPE